MYIIYIYIIERETLYIQIHICVLDRYYICTRCIDLCYLCIYTSRYIQSKTGRERQKTERKTDTQRERQTEGLWIDTVEISENFPCLQSVRCYNIVPSVQHCIYYLK